MIKIPQPTGQDKVRLAELGVALIKSDEAREFYEAHISAGRMTRDQYEQMIKDREDRLTQAIKEST